MIVQTNTQRRANGFIERYTKSLKKNVQLFNYNC